MAIYVSPVQTRGEIFSKKSFRKCLTEIRSLVIYISLIYGALAQLGERMAGSHEVRGSNPLGSTTIAIAGVLRHRRFFLCLGASGGASLAYKAGWDTGALAGQAGGESIRVRRLSSCVRDCSKCTVIAGRTGNKALQTRFARLLRAISNATVHLEQNRARAVQNEQDFPVRRDITLPNEQRPL